MIKKLRKQPYSPKWEQAPKWEQRGRKKYIKKPMKFTDELSLSDVSSMASLLCAKPIGCMASRPQIIRTRSMN
jgi:hypothetical protein